MSSVLTKVDAGICGFVTEISATSEDNETVTLRIESPCGNIQRLAGLVESVDAFSELAAGFDGEVLAAARKCLRGGCSACVVPASISKTVQVVARLALPRTVTIAFQQEGQE